jgi:tripartite-type tricarboxylate transporter receptor subunit TctC
MKVRISLGALAAALMFVTAMAVAAMTVTAQAQGWPARPVTMVVPFAPGGVYDTLGRVYAAALAAPLGQPVVVENVPGAGGMTGGVRIARADPDGYQFLFGGESPSAQVQLLHKEPPYDGARDFAAVALVAEQPLILVTRSGIPAGNLTEFIAYAKVNQGKMQYGSPGTGSGSHLACALFNVAIGVSVTHVPYRGLGPAMQDMLAGRIDYMCPTITTAMAQLTARQVQAPAVLGGARSPSFPDIPTAQEQGLKGFEANSWNAIFLPKGTPRPIVDKLNAAIVAAMDTPEVQQRLRELGATAPPPAHRTPQYLQGFVESEIKTWGAAIEAAGITPE